MFRSATPQVAHTCTVLQTDHVPVVLHCGMCSVILTYSYLITPSECLFIFSSVDCLKSALLDVILTKTRAHIIILLQLFTMCYVHILVSTKEQCCSQLFYF